MDWIDEFLASWEAVEKTTDWRTQQPFKSGAIYPYFYDLVMEKILDSLEKRYPKKSELKKLFAGPSSVKNTMVVFLFHSKYYKLGKSDRMKVANLYRDVLSAYSAKDPFNYYGTNFIYTKSELERTLGHSQWMKADAASPKEMGKLLVSLASLAYSLYNDAMPSLGSEFHGPYDVSSRFGRGHVLIERDYFDLKPVELWPHTRNYKYKSIKVMGVYKDIKLRFDFYGNYTTKDNLMDRLTHWAVLVDNKPVQSPATIKRLREYMGQLTLKQVNVLNSMEFERTKQKFLETDQMQYRNLYRLAGEGWKPTKEMVGSIRGKKLIMGFGPWGQNRKLTLKDIRHFRKIMDPRTELYYSPRVKS